MIISENSKRARHKIQEILDHRLYSTSTDEMTISFQCRIGHELITPAYKTDLHVSKTFLIEFDSIDPEADAIRDRHIWEQYAIKTVRFASDKVLYAQPEAILREINKQLSDKTRYPDPDKEYKGPKCNHCKRLMTWNHPKTGEQILDPKSGRPRLLDPDTGEIHECMKDGTRDGAFYKDGKKYFGGAPTDE